MIALIRAAIDLFGCQAHQELRIVRGHSKMRDFKSIGVGSQIDPLDYLHPMSAAILAPEGVFALAIVIPVSTDAGGLAHGFQFFNCSVPPMDSPNILRGQSGRSAGRSLTGSSGTMARSRTG